MGGRSASLRWRFLPLEAKEYVLRVTIRAVENHEERFGIHPEPQLLAITVKGIGYDPRTRNPHRSVKMRDQIARRRACCGDLQYG